MISLKNLVKVLDDSEWIGPDHDVEIRSICHNSNEVKEGSLFACLRGLKSDGHDFAKIAVKKGAVAFLTEKPIDVGDEHIIIRVQNTRKSLGSLAAAFYGFPSAQLKTIGITGTNGKTTTSYMISSLFHQIQKQAATIGTVGCRIGEKNQVLTLTTPEAVEIQRLLHQMVQDRIEYVVMEVSSHGLDLHRVRGIQFNTAIFTNISMAEHLDYHETFENYRDAKKKLFEMVALTGGMSIINKDDPNHGKMLIGSSNRYIYYGIKSKSEIRATRIKTDISGTRFLLHTPAGKTSCRIRIPGYYNVYNALAAASVGVIYGIELEDIVQGLERLEGVPGRFQRIDDGQKFSVIVDFAHTSDALKNFLEAARGCKPNKLITVFGCGGDRDESKRPEMGKVAAALSDHVIITTDNCRTEDPGKIIDDIEAGIENGRYESILDRKDAIRTALSKAGEGDMVVIAGKGHETYQIFKDEVIHFDDREVCTQILLEMGYRGKIFKP